MEASVGMSKRKRRKTRRNLNEIKKRCDRATLNTISGSHSNPKNIACKFNDHISSNRLTLFNKAIQSKTVLRGQVYNTINNAYLDKINTKPNNLSQINLLPKKIQENITPDNRLNNTENIADNNISNPTDSISLSSSTSELQSPLTQSTLHSHESFDMYEEFVNRIPMYLKESAPKLLTESDAMKKNELSLQQMQLEMLTKKHENKILGLKHYSFPIIHKLKVSPTVTCSSQSSWELDLGAAQNSTQSDSSGPHLNLNRSNGAHSPHYYLSVNQYLECDSPEYKYYPHRLNQ